jgi:hypothetical protein
MRLLLVLLLALVPFTQAFAATIGVPASPLWTNTGVLVLTTDTVSFTGATGDWTYQGSLFGPEGVFVPGVEFDEWIQNGQHGQLIGFIGSVPDLNAEPRAINQDDAGLFAIGAGPASVTGKTGTLWLGINDGFVTGTSDNEGSVSVNVNVNADLAPVPEPATLLLFGTTAGGLALARWRRRRRDSQEP